MTTQQIIDRLNSMVNPEKVAFKEQKFGVIAHNSLGIYHKDLKVFTKEIGRNDQLAIELFDTGIYEARLLCSKIFSPRSLTEDLMEKWVSTFENWEICDSFCMGIFAKSPFAVPKALAWSHRKPEFEKRASFAIMAAYCMADKHASNAIYEEFLPIIERGT